MNDFWSACLTRFERELPAQQFNTWIKGLKIEASATDANAITLSAPNRWVLNWVRERCLNDIEAIGRDFVPGPIIVQLSVDQSLDLPAEVEDSLADLESADLSIAAEALPNLLTPGSARAPRFSDPVFGKTRLNPDFTFDNLVTGRANDLARAAAQQVAQNPGVSYNPLFIYGGVGLGKTHLIHAI